MDWFIFFSPPVRLYSGLMCNAVCMYVISRIASPVDKLNIGDGNTFALRQMENLWNWQVVSAQCHVALFYNINLHSHLRPKKVFVPSCETALESDLYLI